MVRKKRQLYRKSLLWDQRDEPLFCTADRGELAWNLQEDALRTSPVPP